MKRHAERAWRAIVVLEHTGRLVIYDRLRRPRSFGAGRAGSVQAVAALEHIAATDTAIADSHGSVVEEASAVTLLELIVARLHEVALPSAGRRADVAHGLPNTQITYKTP